MERKSVIFDLDGTLADISERRRLFTREDGKILWDEFYDPKNTKLDLPNYPVITAYKIHRNSGHRMVIFSGRSERTRESTLKWLSKYGITFDKLYMRPDTKEVEHQLEFKFPGIKRKPTDFRYTPDDELKLKWLNEEFPGDSRKNLICTYDDRDKVVAMWRSQGIACFQVAPGNF